MPQHIHTVHDLDLGWTQCPTLDVVLYQMYELSVTG